MQYRAITLAAWALTCSGAALANPNDPATADDPASQPQQSEASQWPQETSPQQTGQSTYEQSAQPSYQQPSAADAGQPAAGQATEPQLVSAEELVGKSVTTRSGETAGTIKYLTIDLADGAVSHLIVDTAGTSFAAEGDPAETAGETAIGAEPATEHEQDAIAGTQTDHDAVQGQDTVAGARQDDTGSRQQHGQAQDTGSAVTGTGQPGQSSAAPRQTASLLILPWTVVQVDQQSGQIQTSASAQQIAQAPRLATQDLNQLTEPALMAYVVDYWAPASELAAFEAQRQQQQQREGDAQTSEQSTTSDETTPYSDEDVIRRDPKAADRQPDQASRQQQTGTDTATGQDYAGRTADESRTAQAASPTAQTPQPEQRSGEPLEAGEQQAMVLVGQGVVTQVMPPMFHLSRELKGAAVQDQNGQQVGEIRRIVIDQQSGRAAYAVVENTASGGPAPVPLAALEWSAEGTTTLTADAANLQADQALAENPQQAQRADLAQLYQRFGVEPYWNTGDTAGSRPQLEP